MKAANGSQPPADVTSDTQLIDARATNNRHPNHRSYRNAPTTTPHDPTHGGDRNRRHWISQSGPDIGGHNIATK
jgi:hypothetical protein